MTNKKSISPVVATALILVVAVVAVVGFQTWFQGYSSTTFTNVETQSDTTSTSSEISDMVGNTLYVKSSGSDTIKIQAGDKDCYFSVESGMNKLDMSYCLGTLSSGKQNVMIVLGEQVLTKTVVVKEKISYALDDKLVSYYSFNTDATDQVGTNDGTINDATHTSSGRLGGAYEFDGVDDYISVADNSSIDFGSGRDMSFSLWLYADSVQDAGSAKRLLNKRTDDNHGYVLTWGGSNLLATFIKGVTLNRAGSTGVSSDTWHHFIATFDNSTSTTKAYLDGVEVINITGSTDIGTTGTDLLFGKNTLSQSNFNGTIDEVMIFNKTLSQEEITNLYNQGK